MNGVSLAWESMNQVFYEVEWKSSQNTAKNPFSFSANRGRSIFFAAFCILYSFFFVGQFVGNWFYWHLPFDFGIPTSHVMSVF